MNREDYTKSMNKLWQSNYTFQEECKKSIDIKTEYILSLEAKIAKLEENIDNAIIELEDCGWYESNDKEQTMDVLYKLKEV